VGGTRSPEKRPFLVVYDYGMGGLWAFIKARDETEVLSTYPELSIVESRPAWMGDDRYARLLEEALDIDDRPLSGLLRDLVADRKRAFEQPPQG
jgi:hypothetical protein